MEIHNIDPVYDKNSEILILGSFPSVKSRQQQFFYAHPQNRFWKVVAALTKETVPDTIEQKKQLLLRNRIAVWDVIKKCEITGSRDDSIENVEANDIASIIKNSSITRIFCNGNKSYELYNRYVYPETAIEAVRLPSTSPANAAYSQEKLIEKWKSII